MKRLTLPALGLAVAMLVPATAMAEDYKIDIEGAHASINFRVKHLGYSWLVGRFDKFNGNFSFDAANPGSSNVAVTIDTTSVNSNHAARDKHLRSADFLNTDAHPTATFESTSIEVTGDNAAVIKGNLTLLGVTKEVSIDATYIGGGDDPWGGHRQGFEGTTSFVMEDFGMKPILGPASATVYLDLQVEGIRQ